MQLREIKRASNLKKLNCEEHNDEEDQFALGAIQDKQKLKEQKLSLKERLVK